MKTAIISIAILVIVVALIFFIKMMKTVIENEVPNNALKQKGNEQ